MSDYMVQVNSAEFCFHAAVGISLNHDHLLFLSRSMKNGIFLTQRNKEQEIIKKYFEKWQYKF